MMPTNPSENRCNLFRIRTITAFVHLSPHDFASTSLETKIRHCSQFLYSFQSTLVKAGYQVQTLRIATNPFGEFLPIPTHIDSIDNANDLIRCLDQLDDLLEQHHISLCALGPATSLDEVTLCPTIIAHSSRWSCSSMISVDHVEMARATAVCILNISKLEHKSGTGANHSLEDKHTRIDITSVANGIGNFRFCATSTCCPVMHIPFFPAASASTVRDNQQKDYLSFALGLENGSLACYWLKQSQSIAHISTIFRQGMAAALKPLEDLCHSYASSAASNPTDPIHTTYLGIDTSLNPSLDTPSGSVAAALETLDEVSVFGGAGTLAAAAAVTVALQSLPGITKTGYCGFMLPVCEDLRLAELATKSRLRISNLLCVSAVCGVGVDTVPIAGDVDLQSLISLLLDVGNLASRWNKPLSCRVFPVPGKGVGEMTEFDSPYLCNSMIMDIE